MLGGLLVGQERRQRGGLGQAEAVADARVRERLLDAVHEALGDRRAAVGDPANAAHVELGELRVVDHRVVDRRHRDELVDAVRADRLKKPSKSSGPERISTRPPNSSTRDQLAVAAGHVEQRHRHSVEIAGPSERSIDEAAERVLAVGHEVAVGGHRPLREAGRAARVEDRREILRRRGPRRPPARRRAAAARR